MKIPSVEKLASGNYRIRLRLGGEIKSITRSTAKECIKCATLIKAEYKAGKRSAIAGDAMTLYEAIDEFLAINSNVLSPETIRGYRVIQRNRFKELMNKPINKITQTDLQKAVNDSAAVLAPKTVKNTGNFVMLVLKEHGYTFSVKYPQSIKKDKEIMSPSEIQMFCERLKGSAIEIPCLLALCSLRKSEIYALKWSNIDFKKKIIHVAGAMVYNEHGERVLKPTNKNDSSHRDVPIMIGQLYNALKGAQSDSNAFVVTTPSTTITRKLGKFCDDNGFTHTNLHGLRHCFASLCAYLGLNMEATMAIGGWSDWKTMKNIYTHVYKDDILRSSDKYTEFFKNGHENGHDVQKTL